MNYFEFVRYACVTHLQKWRNGQWFIMVTDIVTGDFTKANFYFDQVGTIIYLLKLS